MEKFFKRFVALGLVLGAGGALASSDPPPAPDPADGLARAQGLVMLDYQVIKVPGNASIDLVGFHVLNRMNDWFYLGVGGYAPLVSGDYGGFMAFDVTAHVQRRLVGRLFGDAGVALGGGGGGKSVEQSKVLSGTGGFAKAYVGLGYDFQDFSLGAQVSKFKFKDSAINNTQLNVFVQVPFSYTVGAYARAGAAWPAAGEQASPGSAGPPGETMLSLGVDHYAQIDPEGLNKGDIQAADLQFAHFFSPNHYWYAQLGVGFRGLPLYNQVLAGIGHRARLSPRTNLYAQVAVGSGGYAPDTINTGPGWLIYPKLSAEYMLDSKLGLAVSAGYLFAPKGSSKNYTLGASLNYHLHGGGQGPSAAAGAGPGVFSGYRFHLFQQTEVNVERRGIARGNLNMLAAQVDVLVNDHLYLPMQGSVAYNAYLGYPGYGELLAGAGLQNSHRRGDRLQFFGQLLVGTNVHGAILKTGVGVNLALSDRLALYGQLGQTRSLEKNGQFKADHAGIGLSYRFSIPGR